MFTQTQQQTPTISTTTAEIGDPFETRFGHRLPRGLRAQAHGMQWRTFMDTFSTHGDLRLSNIFEETKTQGKNHYYAQINDVRGDRRISIGRDIEATGAVSACTSLLWDLGKPLEILNFHQCEIFEATVTFIYVGHLRKEAWAVGFGPDSNNSIAAAMSAAVYRIHG